MDAEKAVIDIGTNSVKFCLGRRNTDGTVEFLIDTSVPARLGEGTRRTGLICVEALKRNVLAVADFVRQARDRGADEIAVIGTAAVRAARNAEEFARRVNEATGLSLRVLSGEEEARLSYDAVVQAFPEPPSGTLMTMDTGGGSTEFVFAEEGAVARTFSVPLGAVVVAEEYGLQNAVRPERVRIARRGIRALLTREPFLPASLAVGFGGSVTALAAADQRPAAYSAAAVHGARLSREAVETLISVFASQDAEERRAYANLPPGRADIALGGACIVAEAMAAAGVPEITVCSFGLRHALLRRMLGGSCKF